MSDICSLKVSVLFPASLIHRGTMVLHKAAHTTALEALTIM